MSIQKPRLLRTGETLDPIALELTLATDDLPAARITIADDPGVELHDALEIWTAQGSAGLFRVTDRSKTYAGEISLTCKGALDTLSDDVFPGTAAITGTVSAAITSILSKQSTAKWQLGTCAMSGNVKIDNSYNNLYELMENIRQQHPGYWWTYNYATTPWTVNLAALPNTLAAEFRLGRNVSSTTIALSDAEMCTKLYMTVTSGSTSTLYTYDDATAQSEWGVITKCIDVNADDLPGTPAEYAAEIFAERGQPLAFITLEGYDLKRITGDDFDKITLGSNCRVVLEDFAGTFTERVTRIQWPNVLDTPDEIRVSLANNLKPFREQLNLIRKTAGGAARKSEENERELIIHQTAIDRNDERILLWATEEQWDEIAEQYQITHKSQLDITAQQIESTVVQTGITAGVNTFSPDETYAAGAKCIYNGVVYQFTSAHSGAWTGTDVRQVPTINSRVTQTESSWSATVQAIGDNGQITAASIAASINATTGQSIVKIDADHIVLDGSAVAASLTTETIECDGIDVGSGGVTIDNQGYIDCSGITINGDTLDGSFADWIVDAEVSGNVLTLTKFDGTSVTFSKATTLTGAWGSGATLGTYTVTAEQNGVTVGSESVSPGLQLSGGAPPVANFSAQMTDATQNPPSVKKSVYGYLILDDNGAASKVDVNTESDGSGTNVATIDVSSVYADGVEEGGTTAWLFYTNTAGSNHQGTLQPNAYLYIAYKDENGNYVDRYDDTWKTPSGSNPSISGSWNGSGTYNITSSPSPAAGSKTSITPSIRLNGSGSSTFTAEMLDDTSSPTVQKSVTGYLHQNGNSMGVYKTYSGGSYSDIIASLAFSPGTTGTISADCTDQGDPSGDTNGNAVTATCTCGATKNANIYLTNGSWNSSGQMALNARLGSSSGKLIDRIWITSGSPAMSSNVASIGTNRGNRTNAGSISKSSLQANTYLGFAVKCNNKTTSFYITVNA